MKPSMQVCAWCSLVEAGAANVDTKNITHGICAECYSGEFIDKPLSLLSEEEFDLLPFGGFMLDREAIVVKYNKMEESLSRFDRKDVIGKNFFSDIAPCTQVKDFLDRYQQLLASDVADLVQFDFVYMFGRGLVHVNIFMSWNPELELVTVLAREVAG